MIDYVPPHPALANTVASYLRLFGLWFSQQSTPAPKNCAVILSLPELDGIGWIRGANKVNRAINRFMDEAADHGRKEGFHLLFARWDGKDWYLEWEFRVPDEVLHQN